MNELQENLDTAFALISTIPVSGDNVERMANAKILLREAFRLAEIEPKEKPAEKELKNG